MALEDGFIFTETCEDVNLASCTAGTRHIDPCNCRGYYTCDQPINLNMFREGCPGNTTAWDHTTEQCDFFVNVINNGLCNTSEPWGRCNVSESRALVLQQRCTGSSVVTQTTSTTTTSTSSSSVTEAPSTGIDAGIVAGAVIGGAVLMLIIVAIVVITLRRRKRKHPPKRTDTQMNPEYFEGNADDPYAIIDDSLNSPVYNHGGSYMVPNPRLPGRTLSTNLGNGSHTGSLPQKGTLDGNTLADTLPSGEPDVEYDNQGSMREPNPLPADPGYAGISRNRVSDDKPYSTYSGNQTTNTHEEGDTLDKTRDSYDFAVETQKSDNSDRLDSPRSSSSTATGSQLGTDL